MATSQPLIPTREAPLVVRPATSFLALTSATGQFEWDGAKLDYKQGLRRRELVRLGEGMLLRLTYAERTLSGGGRRFLWIGPDGRERGEMIESQWPIREVLDVAALARIPVVDLGEITRRDLYERYPAMAPKIGGLDPQTPVSVGVLKQVARNELAGLSWRRLFNDPRTIAMAVMAAFTLGWTLLRAAGVLA